MTKNKDPLSDFFRLISEEKAMAEKKEDEFLSKLDVNVSKDLSELFSQIALADKEERSIVCQIDFIPPASPVVIEEESVVIEEESVVVKEKSLIERSLGILGGTSDEKTSDPLTPLNQKFLTLEDFNKHYKTFVERIQQQLSTLGGGGEVNFRYLDDVNNGTMKSGNDNWVLEYDAATKKVQFTENVGPVKTIKLNTAGPDIATVPGMLAWNPADDCLDVYQNDGTTNQVGLETYTRIRNSTGVPLLNGEVVRFGGANEDGLGVPTAELMDADENQPPLFLVGVITNDIPDGSIGRATVCGNVRGINTTGSTSSESWAVGDILWVHPTLAGKMTKVKPTAPDLAVSVAAVMIVDATEGIILIHPNYAPILSYGTFLNTGDHVASDANTPTNIPIDTQTKARGFTLTGVEESRITCSISGLYNFTVSYQMTSTNASEKNVYFWVRKNGVDVPLTTRKKSIVGNGTFDAFACTWSISLNANDYVQLMWAVNDTTVILEAPSSEEFVPAAPSVLLTISEAAL